MKFKKIIIENFKSIGTEPITVDLGFNGAKLLLGTNGAGKSTIMEAIVWAIYGTSKLKADNVVNKMVGSGTKVEVFFSEGGHEYILTRYRKHPTHKNNLYVFEDGNNITLKNASDNQELVQKIVGIDSRAFLSSIILSSETYKPFLRETNSARLQIFESVFSLKEINELSKLNKQRIKDIEKKLLDKKTEQTSLTSFVEADVNALKSYKLNYENTIKKLDEQINKSELEIEEYKKRLNESDNIDFDKEIQKALEYQSVLIAYNNSKEKIDSLNKLVASQKKELDYYLNEIKVEEDFIAKHPTSELKQAIEDINKYNEANSQIEEINSRILLINQNILTNEADIKALSNKLLVYSNRVEAAKKQIEQINNNVCPVCGNHIDHEHSKEILKEQNQIIDDNEIECDKINHSISNKKLEVSKLNEEIVKLNNEKSNIKLITPKYLEEDIRETASNLKNYSLNLVKYKKITTDKEAQVKELELQISQINVVKPEYNGYSLDTLNNIKKQDSDFRAMIDANVKIIESAKATKETAFDSDYVSKVAAAIKERKNILENLTSEIFSLRKEYAEYQVLDEVFSNGDNGFKKYFINKTISLFNEKVNTFLPFFFDDEIKITFDKDLNDSIAFRGKETEFEELSSGEKTRCELSIVFALYFMVQSMFGCGTNLLVVDEILDTALDDYGISAARRILDDIAKNTAIFVVSHREELKESFKNIIEVKKDSDGFTKIKTEV